MFSCSTKLKKRPPGRGSSFPIALALHVVAILGMGSLAFGASATAGEIDVQLHDDGRTYTIKGPGMEIGPADFGAGVTIDGIHLNLRSSNGKPLGTQVLPAQPSPYGPVEVIVSTVRFEEHGIDLTLRIERPEAAPCVLLNIGITNRGKAKVDLRRLFSLKLLQNATAPWSAGSNLKDWIVTGLGSTESKHRLFSVQLLSDLKEPTRYFEECAVYRKDGTGVFLGPVGKPSAYTDTLIDTNHFSIESSGFNIALSANEEFVGQQFGIFFEPANKAVRRWADWVAKTHGARTSKGALYGWINSTPELKSDAKSLTGVVTFAEASEGRLRPQAIVLDHGTDGSAPLQKTATFPEDLSHYASMITGAEALPGLRLSLDEGLMSRAENMQTIKQAKALGFEMLKLVYRGGERSDQKTDLMLHRDLAAKMRTAAGDSTYLLSVWTKRAALGAFDANRSSSNVRRSGLRPLIEEVLWAFPLNRRWYAVDNDICYLATELADVDPLVGGWPMARTWISMVGLSCGAAFTGDHWFQPKFAPYLRNFEVLQPPATEDTEVLDLGTGLEWPRLAGRVTRPWGEWTVSLLWNPEAKEKKIPLDLARIGAKPGSRYAVWSFWQNTYLGVVQDRYTSGFLAPSASEHLVFTELPPDSTKPILIGSNFHIYCGAAELKSVVTLDSAMGIEFTDAGALDGSLFVYSHIAPVLVSERGCEVSGISAAGENVWRIDIKNRRLGELQRIECSLPLPLHRQSWFWALLMMLIFSTGLGVWRYLVGKRSKIALELARSRHGERARIARDLHDEIGSSLTHISMLGDSISRDSSDPAGVVSRIQQTTADSLRRLNEIVWALNPERDSVEHLADYLLRFAQEFLEASDIRLRTEIQDDIPAIHLSAKARHTIYLAAREAINNAVRHGHPSQVTLRIGIRAGILSIGIEDNGSGFDPSAISHGNGLANMRSRLIEIGGEARISSAPGSGTSILFTLPLPKTPTS